MPQALYLVQLFILVLDVTLNTFSPLSRMLTCLSRSILTKVLTPQRQNSCLCNLVGLSTVGKLRKHCWRMSCIVAEHTVVSLGGGSTETVPLLNGSLGEGTAWFASSGSVESLLCYWPRPGSDPRPPLVFSCFPLYRDRAGHCSCTDRPQQPRHDLRERKLCLQHHRHCPPEW